MPKSDSTNFTSKTFDHIHILPNVNKKENTAHMSGFTFLPQDGRLYAMASFISKQLIIIIKLLYY